MQAVAAPSSTSVHFTLNARTQDGGEVTPTSVPVDTKSIADVLGLVAAR